MLRELGRCEQKTFFESSLYFVFHFLTLFVPRVKEGPLSVPSFYFMYSIWQDTGIRTRVAGKCSDNFPSLPKKTFQCENTHDLESNY